MEWCQNLITHVLILNILKPGINVQLLYLMHEKTDPEKRLDLARSPSKLVAETQREQELHPQSSTFSTTHKTEYNVAFCLIYSHNLEYQGMSGPMV